VPFAVRTHPEHRLAVVRTWGIVTADLLLGAATALSAAPGWDRSCGLVWDGREVETYALGPDGLARVLGLSPEPAPPGPRGPTAIIVRSGSEGDMLAREVGARTGRLGVRDRRVFYSTVAAEEWLGLPHGLLDEP
jgi:hypothetical protein